ncbi:reverse transcriptase domain-containing protein [Tanacetum coccineum]
MAKEDEEKIAFITSQGIYCYSKMPFGLRNAGATYQRLVDKAFHKQVGRNLEVYVDDLVIKSRTEGEIIRDIEETFKKTSRKGRTHHLFGSSKRNCKRSPDDRKGSKIDANIFCKQRFERPGSELHILADFIVEQPEEDSAETPMKIEEKLLEPWILFTDGSSCANGSGVGLILTSPEGMEFTYTLRFGFKATNNEAEY